MLDVPYHYKDEKGDSVIAYWRRKRGQRKVTACQAYSTILPSEDRLWQAGDPVIVPLTFDTPHSEQ